MQEFKHAHKFIGNISQIGGVRRFKMLEGLSKGMEVIEVNNGSGIVFNVLVDKCLDIFNLSYKSNPVSFISAAGMVAPMYYDPRVYGWLKTFGGGLFVTCGLTNVGEPCTYEGYEYGLHGNISCIAAENVNVDQHWVNNEYCIEISGNIRQVRSLVENIVIQRKISATMFKNEIRVTDTITNQGQTRRPLMILYHMNFGYPLVNPNCEFVVPIKSTEGFNEYCEKRKEKCLKIPEPDNLYIEETYIHKVHSTNNRSGFCIINDKEDPEYGVSVTYPTDVLHTLGQNNFFREKEYFIAFEPCNNEIKGADYEQERGNLHFLESGETIYIDLIIKLDTETSSLKKEIENLIAN